MRIRLESVAEASDEMQAAPLTRCGQFNLHGAESRSTPGLEHGTVAYEASIATAAHSARAPCGHSTAARRESSRAAAGRGYSDGRRARSGAAGDGASAARLCDAERKAQEERQRQLRAKARMRRSTVVVQRWWRRETAKREKNSAEVRSILEKADHFLHRFKESAASDLELAIEQQTASERAQARFEAIKGGSVTVALAVCKMFRQRASAAKCIQGANRRMLAERQSRYLAMMIPLQRLLRRSVRAYIARKDEREARVAYDSIDLVIKATAIQKAYRRHAAALDSALVLSDAQHRQIGNVGALIGRLDIFHSSMPLCWLAVASRTELDAQRRALAEQLDSLIRARVLRKRTEPMRLAARRKLHLCEG